VRHRTFDGINRKNRTRHNKQRKNNETTSPLIVLPVYNTAKYLEQCIDSILNQTFKDFELLAIDDCSTDNSLQILRQYEQKDSRVRVFRAINRGGAGESA